jgi:molybdate transport system permease protein
MELEPVVAVILSTLAWALLSTVAVMIVGVPLAYLLARREFPGKRAISAVVSLPMVLPPTAVGYLLLSLLADNGPLGKNTLGIDLDILLNWKGVVVAYAVMSFPLFVRTARVSFEAVSPRLEAMSLTLGRGADPGLHAGDGGVRGDGHPRRQHPRPHADPGLGHLQRPAIR